MARRFFSFCILLLIWLSAVTVFGRNAYGIPWIPDDDLDSLRSVLKADPQQIDFGVMGPGEEAIRTFLLKNVGLGSPEWFAEGPEGWTLSESQNLSGIIGEKPESIRIHLAYAREVGTSKNRLCSLMLRLETEGQSAAFRREVPAGVLREEIRLNYDGGSIYVFFHVKLIEMTPAPVLEVEPIRMDFGTIHQGEQITKRILLNNRGRESLKWQAGIAGGKGMPPTAPPPVGKYISFRDVVTRSDMNLFSGPTQEGIELTGNWEEERGYPAGQGEQNALRFRFTGTGIKLHFWKSPDGGPFSVYFDEQFAGLIEGYAERRERGEALIIEEQPEGPHLLTVVNGSRNVTLEGVRVFGKSIQKGPRGWISIFPDSGFTTRETDYINVSLHTRQLTPGIYGDHVFFTSNGGEADVEVFLEVAPETTPKLLAVHRYLAGSDYLYTTNPKAEASRLKLKGYRYIGIAFHLFPPGTPGTTDFFRWFNPSKGDHYYSYDARGDKTSSGYIFEGAIGNIATSRLTGSKELYRWFNPTHGVYFYTTDEAGEGLAKKGYRFDGIAGFVR